jgi:hypothetical protein
VPRRVQHTGRNALGLSAETSAKAEDRVPPKDFPMSGNSGDDFSNGWNFFFAARSAIFRS